MQVWTGIPARALLRDKLEDRYTEYLAQLLIARPFARQFARHFCKLDSEEIPRVQTWCAMPGGCPDLVLRFDRSLFLFEAKVDSWLHPAQVVPYARYLADWLNGDRNRSGSLFTLSRMSARSALLAESKGQLASAGLAHVAHDAITWEDVAKVAAEVLSDRTKDSRLEAHLEDFINLVRVSIGRPIEGFSMPNVSVLRDRATGERSGRLGS